MSAMSVLDWVVVGLFGGMVLMVAGLIVWVAWGMLRRLVLCADAIGGAGLDDEDDGCDDVPFPEAIEHERGRVRCGCERKDGRDG